MKRFLLALLLVYGFACGETTGNLITNPTFNGTTGWSTTGTVGGRQYHPAMPANGTGYSFSYSQGTIAQTYAINQALSSVGAGIQIQGFDYGFQYQIYCANSIGGYCENPNGTIDSLSYTATITNSNGQSIYTNSQNLSGGYMASPTNIDVQQRFASAYDIANLGNFSISFTGQDNGYWGGNYGPTINNVYSKAVYTVDQCTVNPQSSPSCPGYKTYYNMWDDGYAQVNLPFAFPFYGQVFTTSYMYTNGVVGFLNNNWGFCCDGVDLNGQTSQPNSPWNYAIYALNTDLIPGPNSQFYTQVTDGGTGLKYTWDIVPEIGTNLNNTFHVQIKDSGYIGITYDQVNLNPWRNPLIGIAGDISQGQYSITYFGQASNLPALVGTTNVYTGTETTDICATNPLYSQSCPGYAAAYLNQQCSINPLYNQSCPGYAAAYYSQQCSINALFDVGCPGYASAYLTYQCSINPLYSTTCSGYEQAYFDQQCSISGLYSTSCPNYATAYFDQQCSLDPLYNNQCPGYAEAYALANVIPSTTTNPPVSISEPTLQVSSDGKVSTEVSTTGDSTVDSVIKTETVSATSATATVQLSPTTTSPAAPTQVAQAEPKQEQKQEAKDDNSKNNTKKEESKQESASSSNKSDSGKSSDTKSKREEAKKAAVAKAGKEAAEKIDSAASMQAQVEVQGVVIAAMGFTPGFDAYKFMLPDAPGYKPFEIYKKQRNVDNARMLRGLTGASDKLHDQMIDQQYQNR